MTDSKRNKPQIKTFLGTSHFETIRPGIALLTLVFALSASCAAPPIKQEPTAPLRFTSPNGRPTLPVEFPAVGLLHADNFRCTAFVVDSGVAITAKHCLPTIEKKIEIEFPFGKVTSTAWATPDDEDMALLFYKSPQAPGSLLPAMSLATEFTDLLGPLSFVGYGCSPHTHSPTSPTLTPIVLPRGTKRYIAFFADKVHSWKEPDTGKLRPYYTSPDFLVCGGDSGGPIFITGTNKVVGVAVAALQSTIDGKDLYIGTIFVELISFGKILKEEKSQ